MKDISFLRRNPDFLLIWIGQILSQSAGRMVQIALLWWIVSQITEGSGKAIGSFMVMVALPSLLFVAKIGKIIDRSSSRKLLVRCDFSAFLTLIVLSLLLRQPSLSLPWVYLFGFISATLQAFIDPTLNKSVTEVAPPAEAERAVAFLATTQSLANFAGAVLGALLIEHLGVPNVVFLAAFGYLISSGCSAKARFRFSSAEKTPTERSGWKFLKEMPLLQRVLVGFGLVNFFATPTLVVLPLFTKLSLKGDASLLGILEAGLWIGLLLGSLLSHRILASTDRIRAGAVCMWTMGIGLFMTGAWPNAVLAFTMLWLVGFALGINNVKFLALFQEIVPAEVKGQFFAIMQATIGFTFPVAYFVFGVLTDYISPPGACLVQGIGVFALAIYFFALSKTTQMFQPVPA